MAKDEKGKGGTVRGRAGAEGKRGQVKGGSTLDICPGVPQFLVTSLQMPCYGYGLHVYGYCLGLLLGLLGIGAKVTVWGLFCFWPSSNRRLATSWTYFLHLSLSSHVRGLALFY